MENQHTFAPNCTLISSRFDLFLYIASVKIVNMIHVRFWLAESRTSLAWSFLPIFET